MSGMLITIVIPTLDRPQLLMEALRSVAGQDYPHWEIIVVDDGSAPPVARSDLEPILGNKFQLLRHGTSQGIPAAKNAGVYLAAGEIIFHLDDDDLLAGNALQTMADVFSAHKELDCVFLNIEPFGRFAQPTREIQQLALARLIERTGGREEDGIVFFGDGLFDALLKSVPLALQRPAARRGAWNMVGEMSEGLPFSEPDWTLRAALQCRTALIRSPLCRWRVNGQNFASRPEMRSQALETGVAVTKRLLERLRQQEDKYGWRAKQVRRRLGQAYFDQAYYHARKGHRLPAWSALLRSFFLAPAWKHARLGMRSLFPTRGDGPS